MLVYWGVAASFPNIRKSGPLLLKLYPHVNKKVIHKTPRSYQISPLECGDSPKIIPNSQFAKNHLHLFCWSQALSPPQVDSQKIIILTFTFYKLPKN